MYEQVIKTLLETGALRAVKIIGEREIIRAVRTSYRYNNRKFRKGDNIEITITHGKPNYQERELIKWCKKAGEPLPVKKIQLKFAPKKKKQLKGKSSPTTK